MGSLSPSPAFSVFAVCVLVVWLKMLGVAFAQPIARARAKVKVNPEDSGGELMTSEPSTVGRLHRVLRNDLENVPMFCIIGIVSVMAGAGPNLLMGCSIAFAAARLLHTFFYLNQKSAPRTASFAIGVLATLVLGIGSVGSMLMR